jgi:hypothetical protein
VSHPSPVHVQASVCNRGRRGTRWFIEGCDSDESGSLGLGVQLRTSLCKSDQTAMFNEGSDVTALFELDYLMATALTSLNVVWPSRTF